MLLWVNMYWWIWGCLYWLLLSSRNRYLWPCPLVCSFYICVLGACRVSGHMHRKGWMFQIASLQHLEVPGSNIQALMLFSRGKMHSRLRCRYKLAPCEGRELEGRKGIQLDALWVWPVLRFHSSGLTCSSSVNWNSSLEEFAGCRLFFFPLVLWASCDSAWWLHCVWPTGALRPGKTEIQSFLNQKGYSRRREHCHVCSKKCCPNSSAIRSPCSRTWSCVLLGDVSVSHVLPMSFPGVVLQGVKNMFVPTSGNFRWEGFSRILSRDMDTGWEQRFSRCVLAGVDGNGS